MELVKSIRGVSNDNRSFLGRNQSSKAIEHGSDRFWAGAFCIQESGNWKRDWHLILRPETLIFPYADVLSNF